MELEVAEYYIPAEDEPSVFRSDNNYWAWPLWFDARQRGAYYADWKEKNPDKPMYHCPPAWFALQDPIMESVKLIKRLRNELQPNWLPDPPVFDPAPTMFIGDTRKISLRWVLQYARDNNMSPESAVLVAEHERDLSGLTLDNQEYWQDRWWKDIMALPGIGYPIWRYKVGPETVAVPYLLLPGPISESIVIVQVHEKNPKLTYKLVTIKQKGGEFVGEFTGYEGFGQEQLTALLHTFWAGF